MIRRPPRSTLSSSSAASDVYKRQHQQIRRHGEVEQEVDRPRRLEGRAGPIYVIQSDQTSPVTGCLSHLPTFGNRAHWLSGCEFVNGLKEVTAAQALAKARSPAPQEIGTNWGR